MHGGRRRSAARLIAPLALVLSVVAVLVVLQSSLGSEESGDDTPSQTATDQAGTTETTQRPRRVRATYTVKLNDTLGLISEKTGVSVEQIETLNPELDPQNLIVGQKIKLRE